MRFTRENLDQYLKELAKEFRKRNGKSMPAENQFSEYYRTFSNVVTFRTVTGEYLVAMKLMSGRQYKYDLSDVIGILWEQEKKGQPLSLEQIEKAVVDLYDSYDRLPQDSRRFIESTLADGDCEAMYALIRKMEAENKDILIEYQEEKPGVLNTDNASSIIAAIRKRKGEE